MSDELQQQLDAMTARLEAAEQISEGRRRELLKLSDERGLLWRQKENAEARAEKAERERDEALRVRDLARDASNRDLEAKRQAERELAEERARYTTLFPADEWHEDMGTSLWGGMCPSANLPTLEPTRAWERNSRASRRTVRDFSAKDG